MKKNLILALKVLLSIIFIAGTAWNIYRLCNGYCEEGLVIIIIAITFFVFYLLTWIFPKFTFNLCWKLFSGFTEDEFDYDTGYGKIDKVSFGLLITAVIVLVIGLLVTLFA